MWKLICQETSPLLSAQMAELRSFLQMFIVHGMYNFEERIERIASLCERLMCVTSNVAQCFEKEKYITSVTLKIVVHFKNDHFRTISSHLFCRLYVYLSQKFGSDSHFEVVLF